MIYLLEIRHPVFRIKFWCFPDAFLNVCGYGTAVESYLSYAQKIAMITLHCMNIVTAGEYSIEPNARK